MQTLDAGHIWAKLDDQDHEVLVNLYNHQMNGTPLPHVQVTYEYAMEFRERHGKLGTVYVGPSYIDPMSNRIAYPPMELTYMGRLLVQTCADVEVE